MMYEKGKEAASDQNGYGFQFQLCLFVSVQRNVWIQWDRLFDNRNIDVDIYIELRKINHKRKILYRIITFSWYQNMLK